MTLPSDRESATHRLAEAIAREISSEPASGAAQPATTIEPNGSANDCAFASADDAVEAAASAFRALDALGLCRRRRIVEAMRVAARVHAEVLARAAAEETALGRIDDKIQKNLLAANKTPGPEVLGPDAVSGDHGLTLVEPAPFGVIGAITPVTNPSSTVIHNAIAMVAAGNAVVFNAHPGAKRISCATVRVLHRAIVDAGGPPHTVTCVTDPTIESAQELMRHPVIRLLVVTGGPAVVAAAMSSGKRAVCAGPGNPPAVVDPTADIDKAARDILFGHSFDNNVVCVDEKEVIVVESVAEALKAAMLRAGAVEVRPHDLPRLEQAIFEQVTSSDRRAVMNKRMVGKDASAILREVNIGAGPEVRAILVEVARDHPLVWTEQMMPVLPLVRVSNVDEAIDLAVAVEGGCFHTATMHSHDLAALSKMARLCNCSIFVKNGPGVAGIGHDGEGHTSFTIASPTGEGLTTPRSFSRWRRCTLIDHFRIV